VKHVYNISKTPLAAQSTPTNLDFLISLVTIGFELLTVFFNAFSTIFAGVIAAVTGFSANKNQAPTG